MGEGNKWIIRDAMGRISGPYSTEKILYKIGRGEFTGEESISIYPGGSWIAISKEPQFYDKLLESLAQHEASPPSQKTEIFNFTRPDDDHPTQPARIDPKVEQTVTPAPQSTPPGTKTKKKLKKKKPEDIELVDVRGQLLKEVLRRSKVPAIVAGVGLVLAVLLFSSSPEEDGRVHLLAPQKNQPQADAQALRGHVQRGVSEFLKDTFEGYLKAQNDLVHAVERDRKNPEIMALLCMTYLELWPFAYQDFADMRAISSVVQMSSAVDPGGIHSSTCRTVDLIVRGRLQEAKSVTEAMLEARANEGQPPIIFYYLKGLLLESTSELAAAVGYLQSAQQLWPQWTRPYVLEAQVQIKMEQPNAAANILRRVLKGNPNHAVAKIELGLVEYKVLNRYDEAQELLEAATNHIARAPKGILSRAYFGLAEISLKQGNTNKALRYAQKSYSLNSSNALAKNLIVRLGGVEKLRKTKVKGQQLMYEGDQFFREGDYHAAQAHYKAAFEEDKKNAMAAMKAAQCLWKLSFSTEAIEWLNKAIKADSKLTEAYVLMADYHTERYNFLAASKILATAHRQNSKSPDVFRGFALVELRRGNAEGAINFGKKALQLYETDVETHILMAEAYMGINDYKLAYNYAAKAIEIDVNHRKAQTTYAETLVGLQGVDAGVDYMVKMVTSYPLVMDYRLALGRIYLSDERYDEAEEVLKQITKIEEKPKEAYVELAKVFKARGQLEPALEYLFKAAVLDPADAEPLYQAGMIYLETKKAPEALAQFQRVQRINKLYPLVQFQMGRAALIMNNPEQALEFTRLEKSANPNLADAYLLAAEAHSAMKQYTLCATEYQKAIKLRPQSAPIYVKLAQCYRKAGNLDAAIAMLNHASSKESGLADIYKEQGAIYELKGDIQHAIEAYNQYFVLDPNAPDRAQIEERILTLQRGGRSI